MKKKNGFTLIELLAIIVILAIIAVITVPIILNIIESSKKGAIKDSAYGYKDSVNKWYVSKLTEDPNYVLNDGTYSVSELGATVEGKQPGSNSWVTISKTNVTDGCLQFDEYKVEIINGEVKDAVNGECKNNAIIFANMPEIVTSGDGLYQAKGEQGRYVFRGANPDNYIVIKEDGINDVIYRIVSYESDGTIKVVRNEKIDKNMAFDSRTSASAGPRKNEDNTFCNYSGAYSGCNVWGNMNNTYYNGQTLSPVFKYRFYSNNSAETLQEHSDTGTVNTDSTLNQYLNGTWLTSALSNYIDNHNFNVGGVYYYNGYKGGDKGIVREKEEENLYTWTGKVGLLNITDYAESSTNSSCTDVWSNYFFNPDNETNRTSYEWPCKYDNYNYKSGYAQWSLSPNSSGYRGNVFNMTTTGYFGDGYASAAIGVRPTFYLKSSLTIEGKGTESEPYYIVED